MMQWWRGLMLVALVASACNGDPDRGPCPEGAKLVTRISNQGREEACTRPNPQNPRAIIKDGPYKRFFPNGKPSTDGLYANGQQVGKWRMWYDFGLLHEEADLPDGLRRSWHGNGRLADVRQYKGMTRVGHWQSWFANGALKVDAYYPDGWFTEYYVNGRKNVEGPVKNGLKHGEWYHYWPTGGIDGRGSYRKDRENGIFVNYVADGQPGAGTPMVVRIFIDRNIVGQIPAGEVVPFVTGCELDGYDVCCMREWRCWRSLLDNPYEKASPPPGITMPPGMNFPSPFAQKRLIQPDVIVTTEPTRDTGLPAVDESTK